jgi:glycosyltransferase involved in cell wall biosynthesis
MKVSIITPTIGSPELGKLLESINLQTYIDIEHIIVIDGVREYGQKVHKILKEVPAADSIQRHIIELPYNTGANGYFGHKIYASIPQIVNGDYVIFIDDDNYIHPNHVQIYMDPIKEKGYDWMYCLRKITENGKVICNDDCESLGSLSGAFYNPSVHLIDTNCYCIKRQVLIQESHIWNCKGYNNDTDPDRKFGRKLMEMYPNYACTQQYTLLYMVNNRPGSVKKELFLAGNQVMMKKFGGIPWNNEHPRKILYLVHFDKTQTEKVINRIYSTDKNKQCIGFEQWQLNILDKINSDNDFLIISGYSDFIPSKAVILIHMCFPQELPQKLMKRRDVIKILYTIESPNIRHQNQWDVKFLSQNFTLIISYWSDLLKSLQLQKTNLVTAFPFIHRLDMENPNDLKNVRENVDVNTSTCIILANRGFNQNYQINTVSLQALDYLREQYVREIPNMHCYGPSWSSYVSSNNNVTLHSNKPEEYNDSTINYMLNHTFTLIIENCNADGYVSEKIYDAFMSGSIPLYYGNNNDLTHIPKDTYIDLTQIPPSGIKDFLSKLTSQQVTAYRTRIYEKRMQIFSDVSVNAYNRFLKILYKQVICIGDKK